MKQPKVRQRRLSKRQLSELQVREYIERYPPGLRDAAIEIRPCGKFATVRDISPVDHEN